jgi:hypothetical protein
MSDSSVFDLVIRFCFVKSLDFHNIIRYTKAGKERI